MEGLIVLSYHDSSQLWVISQYKRTRQRESPITQDALLNQQLEDKITSLSWAAGFKIESVLVIGVIKMKCPVGDQSDIPCQSDCIVIST